tara:strand:- start:387 stop:1292 length:906 start_codon:yes stop_codon:yes gene_type:complete
VKKNFLSSLDLNRNEILEIFDLAKKYKNNVSFEPNNGKILGLIFDKASTRTRVSFQAAMSRLGGSTVDLNPNTSQIGRGEPIKDTARVLSKYCNVLAIRTYKQSDLIEYARWSTIPVINALTDLEHPCQALADYLTILEEFKSFDKVTLSYIGDGNNVANSLILCGALLGINLRIASPKGFEPKQEILTKALEIYKNPNKIFITNDIYEAVEGSNVIYTDVWASMGEEDESELKVNQFKGFTVGTEVLNIARNDSVILHCLPAYRGKEITDEVFESKASRIFQQAENRLYAQQALLASILT